MLFKRFVIFALVACLGLGLCACGSNDGEKETTAATTEPVVETTEPVDDGTVTYTVKVVDEAGNPIPGAWVQLCKDTCLPGMTNAEGIAQYNVAEDEYKVSFLDTGIPEGYEGAEEAYYFEDGSYELTITLKTVA